MSNKIVLINKVVKVLFSLLVLGGASQYFLNHEMVKEMFTAIEFPTYLIYPMGIAKILGIVAIWNTKYNTIKE